MLRMGRAMRGSKCYYRNNSNSLAMLCLSTCILQVFMKLTFLYNTIAYFMSGMVLFFEVI